MSTCLFPFSLKVHTLSPHHAELHWVTSTAEISSHTPKRPTAYGVWPCREGPLAWGNSCLSPLC